MARQLLDRDRGYRQLMQTVGALARGASVQVGIFANDVRREGEVSNAELGTIHEFGLGDVPERSWLRGWADENRDAIIRNLRLIGKGIFLSKDDVRVACDRFGQWAVGGIKRRIQAHIPPPNTEATIQAKGSSTPLIDTGQFIGSIQFKTELGQ